MNKDKKKIPQLRFPEFKNEGEWEEKPLEEICTLVRGPFGGALKKEIFINDGFAVYEQSHAIYSDFSSFRYRINEEKYKELKRFSVKSGDLIMSCSGTMGKFAMIPKNYEQGVINQALLKLTMKNHYDNSFVKISLETDDNQNKLLSQSAGGAIKNVVAVSQIRELALAVPSLLEQQKIASCLSSLDEVIEAHSQKLELLKDHKKGLLQNLFPQEGEKVPKVRFKEFEKDGEWEMKSLDEICKLVRGPFGGTLKKEIFVGDGYAVYEQSHAIYSDFSSFRYRINDEKFNELKRFSVKSGDLIMSCSGTMGKFAIIPKDFEKGVINQALLKLTTKKSCNNLFVKISLETDTNQQNLLSQSAGGAIKNVVSVSQIRELKLAIPKLEEQQKIASCLSTLDELISAQAEKIEQLKQHKKGLMQGLFPKMND